MHKAPVMEKPDLAPIEDPKPGEEVHVFGKNLEDRVITEYIRNDDGQDEEKDAQKDDKPDKIDTVDRVDGVEQEDKSKNTFNTPLNDDDDDDDHETRIFSKRKFEALTGEEDEETIFHGEFKLFMWDLSTSNWIERGKGQLKLNDSLDKDVQRSRLIMRIAGTHRILLNVTVKRPFFRILARSKTNLRFSDGQNVWAVSGSNAQSLADLIKERLDSQTESDKLLEKTDKTKEKVDVVKDKEDKPNDNVNEIEEKDETEDKGDKIEEKNERAKDRGEKIKERPDSQEGSDRSEEKGDSPEPKKKK